MKPDTLAEWFRQAGPFGLLLWLFDRLVHFLAGLPEAEYDLRPAKRDDNAIGFGLIVWIAAMLAIIALIMLIKFFPH